MSLIERLRQASTEPGAAGPGAPAAGGSAPTAPAPAPAPNHRPDAIAATDGLAAFKVRAHEALFARMGMRLFDAAQNEESLHAYVAKEIADLMGHTHTPLTAEERQRLVVEITRDIVGLGPVERFLADATVTEVMVNGLHPIYVERAGVIEQTDARFLSEDHLRRVIDRIVSQVGRRIDESSPMVDARLTDGSRVNAVIPPLAVDGPVLTIRKFAKDALGVDDLMGLRTLTEASATMLSSVVRGGLNVLVSGGTGTGKTTMLNVLSSFIPHDERIVTIEDAVELQLRQQHVVRLESRPPNAEGRGEVAIRDLVRNALRMRPDRIVVGEVRGGETLDMLQAMNTGHDGSMSTIHANTPRDALARLETMVLFAGIELPAKAIREQIASALHVVVQLQRFRDGSRRVTHVTEVVGMEGDVITLQDLFRYDHAGAGGLAPTGIRPTFSERLADEGVPLPASLFGTTADLLRALR